MTAWWYSMTMTDLPESTSHGEGPSAKPSAGLTDEELTGAVSRRSFYPAWGEVN
jgi:hypothetical protein